MLALSLFLQPPAHTVLPRKLMLYDLAGSHSIVTTQRKFLHRLLVSGDRLDAVLRVSALKYELQHLSITSSVSLSLPRLTC